MLFQEHTNQSENVCNSSRFPIHIFLSSRTTIEEIWEIIGDKLGFTVEIAQNFFIWGFEEDLGVSHSPLSPLCTLTDCACMLAELLLFADQTYEKARHDWPTYMKKW